jgi:hypothetical protein
MTGNCKTEGLERVSKGSSYFFNLSFVIRIMMFCTTVTSCYLNFADLLESGSLFTYNTQSEPFTIIFRSVSSPLISPISSLTTESVIPEEAETPVESAPQEGSAIQEDKDTQETSAAQEDKATQETSTVQEDKATQETSMAQEDKATQETSMAQEDNATQERSMTETSTTLVESTTAVDNTKPAENTTPAEKETNEKSASTADTVP